MTRTFIKRFHLIAVWLLLAFLGYSSASYAQSHDALPLNGIGVVKENGSDLYIGALYLSEPLATPKIIAFAQMKKRMEIRVVADTWRKRSFSKYWSQAVLLNNDQKTQQALIDDILAFTNLPKDNLVKGDRITIDYTPAQGSRVYINDTLALSTEHDPFFSTLLWAWLGEHPPSSTFKTNLTSPAAEHKAKMAERLRTTEPKNKQERYNEVAAWYQLEPEKAVITTAPAATAAPAVAKPTTAATPKPVATPAVKTPAIEKPKPATTPVSPPAPQPVAKTLPEPPPENKTPETMEEMDDVKAWLLERLEE